MYVCVQVLHVQKVLMRKRDPVTHVVFIDLLTDSQVHGHVVTLYLVKSMFRELRHHNACAGSIIFLSK